MSKIIPIQTLADLEKTTGKTVAENQRTDMQKILEKMPVKLTGFLFDLCNESPAVAAQFLPNVRELEDNGQEITWFGIFQTGIYGLERMYADRCIIMPFNSCPANCRFCFRKFYRERLARPMTNEEMDLALQYIAKDDRIQEVLITGGDPFMDPVRLEYLLQGLRKTLHVNNIRIGTRSFLTDPGRITGKLVKMLLKYHDFNGGRPIEIATHFNHPDELAPKTLKALNLVAKSSIRLYNQTVLLKGVNDKTKILLDLFRKLHNHGVEIYYLFHCEPVRGIEHLRTTIEKGIEIKKELRSGLASGRINPAYIVSTQIGKVEIGVDGIIEKREGDSVWIKTPYRLTELQKIDPNIKLPDEICKIGSDGRITIKYLNGK